MNAIAQFNQLGGKTVSRQSLISLKELAYLEGSHEIIVRIDTILNQFPEGIEFDLEVEKPVTEIGLGAAQHSGLYREALDDCGRLQKGYKFENGFVVKVSTGQADKNKFKKATAKEVEKPKKSASNYGKKRPFTKSEKVISIAKQSELQKLEENNPELLKSDLYNSFSDAEKLKFLTVRTELEKKSENNNFDFLFEATGKGYYIKTFLELPTSRSVKFTEISDSVEGLRYYNASDKGLDELQKIYKNSKYGDKNSLGSKDLLNPNEKPTRTPKKATKYSKKRDYESVTSKYPFSKDDIPYQTAYNAHSGTSFSPEKRAVSEQKEYFQHLEHVFKTNRKKAVALGKLEEFETKFERYKEGYLKRFLEHVRSKIGFYSTMIAGPANFPVRRMEKKANAINAKLNVLIDYQKYADFFKAESGIIKTGSETALSKLEAKLKTTEEVHTRMLEGNKLLKKLRADKNATEKDYKDAFINIGFDLETSKKEANYMFNYSYAGFFTTNSSAKIRTIKKQIALEKRLKEKAVVSAENPTETTFKGGSIENDFTDNRIKVFFDSIPEPEVRSFLKKAGQAFKWSPKNKAWQRQLNTYYSGNRNDLYKFLGVNEPEPKEKKVITLEKTEETKADSNAQGSLFGTVPEVISFAAPEIPKQVIPYVPNVVPAQENILVPEAKAKPEPQTNNKLMQMEFDSLTMDEGWENLIQDPAKNMKIAIWGKPKNGKTSGALQLASYLTKFGSVIYNFVDQGFNKSTKDLWIDSGLSEKPNATPSDITSSRDLEKELKTGNYTFCFIDMISDWIRTEKMKPEEFKERFMRQFPNVSFILIFEVTKGGDFKGDQGWTHLVDAIMTVEDFLIENRGRYGMGEKIVWEEGFKKFNPKKYAEFMENKEPEETEEEVFSEEIERI